MEAFLKANPKIDVLYAHNDDMGLGAIEAIEAAGKKPGVDIKIITVDAVKDGMTALAAGKINFIVECSPLLGTQLMDLAKKVVKGESIPQRVLTVETTFTRNKPRRFSPSASTDPTPWMSTGASDDRSAADPGDDRHRQGVSRCGGSRGRRLSTVSR